MLTVQRVIPLPQPQDIKNSPVPWILMQRKEPFTSGSSPESATGYIYSRYGKEKLLTMQTSPK